MTSSPVKRLPARLTWDHGFRAGHRADHVGRRRWNVLVGGSIRDAHVTVGEHLPAVLGSANGDRQYKEPTFASARTFAAVPPQEEWAPGMTQPGGARSRNGSRGWGAGRPWCRALGLPVSATRGWRERLMARCRCQSLCARLGLGGSAKAWTMWGHATPATHDPCSTKRLGALPRCLDIRAGPCRRRRGSHSPLHPVLDDLEAVAVLVAEGEHGWHASTCS